MKQMMRRMVYCLAVIAVTWVMVTGGTDARAAKPASPKAAAPKKSTAKKPAEPTPFEEMMKNSEERIMPVRRLTGPPGYHWFSYYDVAQFDPTGRYMLAMAVNFELRVPTPEDAIAIGMIDLKNGDAWTTLGTSRAWCWQQGCRLQWRPGSDREVLWNDRENGAYVCRILDVRTKKMRTIPSPIDHLSPDGRSALAADFTRIGSFRIGYGYAGLTDPYAAQDAPRELGVWKVDLESGERRMLFSLADIAAIATPGHTPGQKGRHYVNHFGWAPDGKRFIFLNRGEGVDRMFTADAEGRDIRFIGNKPSHFCWRDGETILNWTGNAYRLYKGDGSTPIEGEVLFRAPNGHQTYIPGGEWLLTDSYPQGKERIQYLYLYNLKTGKKVIVGKFNQPQKYAEVKDRGEAYCRCDTHPRLSPDGTTVTIDSTHEDGRQIYLIDIGAIVGKK